jgi:hypothetical protein
MGFAVRFYKRLDGNYAIKVESAVLFYHRLERSVQS